MVRAGPCSDFLVLLHNPMQVCEVLLSDSKLQAVGQHYPQLVLVKRRALADGHRHSHSSCLQSSVTEATESPAVLLHHVGAPNQVHVRGTRGFLAFSYLRFMCIFACLATGREKSSQVDAAMWYSVTIIEARARLTLVR